MLPGCVGPIWAVCWLAGAASEQESMREGIVVYQSQVTA